MLSCVNHNFLDFTGKNLATSVAAPRGCQRTYNQFGKGSCTGRLGLANPSNETLPGGWRGARSTAEGWLRFPPPQAAAEAVVIVHGKS